MTTATKELQMLIGGKWTDSASGEYFETFNPATGKVLAELPRGNAEDIDNAVGVASKTFESDAWQKLEPAERGRIMLRMAQLIRERREELARIESLDTGKPLSQARTDVDMSARYFEYFGGVADKILGQVIPVKSGIFDFTIREPMGVSAQIIPWNYPIQIASRGVAPALAAGNCIVLKPAEEASLGALELAKIAKEAGLPNGVLNVVTGLGEEAGAALASHPRINHLTFTGSVEVGTLVMQAAAKNIVPVTLELGGKSPNILFADADIEGALPTITRSIIQNCGQTCSAGSRLLVDEKVHDQVVEALKKRFSSVRIGPPLDDPDLGPLISQQQRERVMGYMDIARQEGVAIAVGGGIPDGLKLNGGYYFQPTILDNSTRNHRVFNEEIFGPVLTVSNFREEKEAIELANATPYGLLTGIWTKDINKAMRAASRVRSGQVYINSYGAGGGIELPFGGYGKSGFGREKGLEALLGYTQVKNVAITFN